MSSLLEQAIVDAKALKEAALKNAEASIIEKYSSEVKSTLDKLLEQEEAPPGMEGDFADLGGDLGVPPEGGVEEPEMGMGGPQGEELFEDDDELTLSATDGLDKSDVRLNEEDDEVPVTINLDALREAIENLENQLDEEEEIDLNEEDLASLFEEDDLFEGAGDVASKIMNFIKSGGKLADFIQKAASITGDAADVEQLVGVYAGNTEELEKDAQALEDIIKSLRDRGSVAASPVSKNLELSESDLESLFEEDEEDEGDEDLDAMADAIMEKLRVDTGADLSGWAGLRSEEKKYQMESGLAARKSTGVDEEIKAMKKAQEELVFENKSLKKKISQLASVLEQAKDNLQEVNVSNARLLYTNRVLRNTSLNERQKTKIVEAISKAGSVKEAKTIFESLQSTVASTPNRRPQSLSEAISRPSQLIRASRHQDQKPVDPFTDRWKKLAGI